MNRLIAVILTAGIGLYSTASDAFVPVPRAMACMLYFRSDAVFTGEVISVKENQHTDAGEKVVDGWFYTLKVLRSYRGADAPTIQVYTSNDSGRLPLTAGKKYLLFAEKDEGTLTIADDDISGEIKVSKQALKGLERILARKAGEGGDVFGRVTEEEFSDSEGGIGGIHVNVKGPAGSASAVTNKNGWFHVHVAAGDYSATASAPNLVFESQDIAWEDSDNFQVPDGGCAEIQIQARTSRSTSN